MNSLGKTPGKDAVKSFEPLANYHDGEFRNSIPTEVTPKGKRWDVLKEYLLSRSSDREPKVPIPVSAIPGSVFDETPSQAIRVYWLGHASLLLEIGQKRYLIDPVLCERASMVQWLGPKRLHPSPLKAEDIGEVDGVIISHNHYDHLDYQTLKTIQGKVKRIFVPLGIRETLLSWGFDPTKIVELNWWDSVMDGENQLVVTPARHFTGRTLFDTNKTLWCSWAIINSQQKVYFGGDSGMMPEYREIGERLGPFDLTILGIGAYNESWKDIHTNPAEAVEAHLQLRGRKLLPIHWGTFDLALHTWDEPIEWLEKEAIQRKIDLLTPEVGELVSVENFRSKTWWKKKTEGLKD